MFIIPIPEWLFVFEAFPKNRDIPRKPQISVPMPPLIPSIRDVKFGEFHSIEKILPIDISTDRASACYLSDDNEIYLWADRLLHKHVITNRKDRLFLMAMPNAPKGEVILKGNVFCSEYDDWKEIELTIYVV